MRLCETGSSPVSPTSRYLFLNLYFVTLYHPELFFCLASFPNPTSSCSSARMPRTFSSLTRTRHTFNVSLFPGTAAFVYPVTVSQLVVQKCRWMQSALWPSEFAAPTLCGHFFFRFLPICSLTQSEPLSSTCLAFCQLAILPCGMTESRQPAQAHVNVVIPHAQPLFNYRQSS